MCKSFQNEGKENATRKNSFLDLGVAKYMPEISYRRNYETIKHNISQESTNFINS